MTTRTDLLLLANKEQPAGSVPLMNAILEARVQRQGAEMRIAAILKSQEIGRKEDPYADSGSITAAAIECDVANGKLATLFTTLAICLESAGIETGY